MNAPYNWPAVPGTQPLLPRASIVARLSDQDFSLQPFNSLVYTSVAFTAAHTLRLPPAASVPPGSPVYIADFANAISATNTLTIAVASGEQLLGMSLINSAGCGALAISDGLDSWDVAPLPTTAIQAITNDTNVTASITGQLLTLAWSGTLAAARLNANVVQAVTNDTNVTGSIASQALTLGWTGTLAAARLNANVVQSVNNDTNITGSISAQALTLGWTGTLAAARLNANVVQSVTNDTNVTGSIATQGLTLGWSGTLGPTRGGLGFGTATQGDILYSDASNSWAKLAKSTTANSFLKNSGTSNNPAWARPATTDLSDIGTFNLNTSGTLTTSNSTAATSFGTGALLVTGGATIGTGFFADGGGASGGIAFRNNPTPAQGATNFSFGGSQNFTSINWQQYYLLTQFNTTFSSGGGGGLSLGWNYQCSFNLQGGPTGCQQYIVYLTPILAGASPTGTMAAVVELYCGGIAWGQTGTPSLTISSGYGVQIADMFAGKPAGVTATAFTALRIESLSTAATNYAIFLAGSGLVVLNDTTQSTGINTGALLTAGGLGVSKAIYAGNEIKSTSPSAGVGYATGAGSTVTQATSRVTGVTINAICGAITLVTATPPGSGVAQQFVVTNSAVGINDTVLFSIRSAGNIYWCFATGMAAGQFNLNVATMAGAPAPDTPIINFTIIKSVTS